MTDFVRGSNPVWYMVNLQGLQFDDTYYMWVLTNTIPYIPQAVYHTPTGNPWTDPIQFQANGTLPVDIYFDPTLVYRLEIRHNIGPLPPSQADPLIYLVENYSPNGDVQIPIDVSGISTENQLANSQFVEFNLGANYSLSGVPNPPPIEVAPGWFLSLVGNGSVNINQVPLSSTVPTPTNAPYALQLDLTGGWTSNPVLYQRLPVNGVLWANKHVALSFTAMISGVSQNITTRLDTSNGGVTVLGVDTLTNSFVEYQHVVQLPASTNTDVPPAAYIDFKVILPPVADILITSLQLVALDAEAEVPYQQESADRQVDHLFHYYKDKLEAKPIPSYLTGWDFPLNPAQFVGSSLAAPSIGANKSQYAWDQTIVFQSANSSIAVSRASGSGDLVLTASAAGQTAIIQYLDATQARRLLSNKMAVNLSAFSTNGGGLVGTVSLWATSDVSLPNVASGTNNSIVLTLDANGKPATQNGTWTEVPRSNFGDARFNLSGTLSEFDFNGWDMSGNALVNTATYFAIVIGFAPMSMSSLIDIQYASLCSGDIATRPAPVTPEQVLRDCEYYYEKSYTTGSFATNVTNVNAITKVQSAQVLNGGGSGFRLAAFDLEYKTVKRSLSPVVSFYSPGAGTIALLDATITTINLDKTTSSTVNISNWTASASGDKAISYIPNTPATGPAVTGSGDSASNIPLAYLKFHYVIDARLGIA